MGHTGGQEPDGGHFLRMVILGLELFFQGHIAHDNQNVRGVPLTVAQRSGGQGEMAVAAVNLNDGVQPAHPIGGQGLTQNTFLARFAAVTEDLIARLILRSGMGV